MVMTDNTLVLMYRHSPMRHKFKPIDMKKIAFCGSSGCGKTTLAKYVSELVGIPFIPMSQKGNLSKEDVDRFKEKTNNNYHEEISHEMLIYLTNRFPNFGIDFQFTLLKLRRKWIEENPEFITDRSPVDNMVYFLSQCSNYADTKVTAQFINIATKAFSKLDAVVLLNPLPKLENDGTRIVNPYYQEFIHNTFEMVLTKYCTAKGPFIFEIKESDINIRLAKMKELLINS